MTQDAVDVVVSARGRGRPPVGKTIEVRLPDTLRAALDAHAKAEGVPVAEAARRLIAGGLDRQ